MPERCHPPGLRCAALIALTCAAACLSGCTWLFRPEGEARKPLVAPEVIPPGARLTNDGMHRLRLEAERAHRLALDVRKVEDALYAFSASEGQPPASLDELVTRHYLPELPRTLQPGTFIYDPDTLKVTLVSAR